MKDRSKPFNYLAKNVVSPLKLFSGNCLNPPSLSTTWSAKSNAQAGQISGSPTDWLKVLSFKLISEWPACESKSSPWLLSWIRTTIHRFFRYCHDILQKKEQNCCPSTLCNANHDETFEFQSTSLSSSLYYHFDYILQFLLAHFFSLLSTIVASDFWAVFSISRNFLCSNSEMQGISSVTFFLFICLFVYELQMDYLLLTLKWFTTIYWELAKIL